MGSPIGSRRLQNLNPSTLLPATAVAHRATINARPSPVNIGKPPITLVTVKLPKLPPRLVATPSNLACRSQAVMIVASLATKIAASVDEGATTASNSLTDRTCDLIFITFKPKRNLQSFPYHKGYQIDALLPVFSQVSFTPL